MIGLVFAYAGSALDGWRRYADRRRAGLPGVVYGLQVKLTGAMLLVLALDGSGYLLAVTLDPQYSTRIFQLFQRLHERDRFTGSGIGLAICKKIIELRGGRIWMEPADRGSVFHFTLSAAPQQG